MKITFPHMGNTYICVKALLDDLKLDYILPPFKSKGSLELGTKFTPEFACLPLKITIGDYIQAYHQGADTILMAGGCGPCRFGYYCEMQREIMKDIGFEMDMIALEMPKGDISGFLRKIRRLAGNINPLGILKVIKNTAQIAKQVDQLEALTYRLRPRETRKGSVDSIYKWFRSAVLNARGSAEIKKLIAEAERKLLEVEIDESIRPMKVGIVGEIYTTIDADTSFNIDQLLGSMGIEVDRYVTVSGWIIDHIIKPALHLPVDLSYAEAAKPYLGAMIGGHARETIGNTVLYAKNGYDGIVQIYPLTCMPEIVAASILPSIERDFNIPILTLILDEMSGEAGYMTRLEAFVDLLKKRREIALGKGQHVLSGN